MSGDLLLATFSWTGAAGRPTVAGLPQRLYRALEGGAGCAYLASDDGQGRQALAAAFPDARFTPLRRWSDVPGASAGEAASFHYVVRTDVDPEWEERFNAWYDTEHLPGLAAVPGTVRAQRLVSEGEGPRYLACYDLATRETFGSPPWLAVRATPWSSEVRPWFRNTTRVMYRLV